jgi:hypothetical protein
MKQNALNWFEIYTNDINKAADFYGKILAKPLSMISNDKYNMAMFPSDLDNGVGGALTQMDKCQPGAGGTVVYLNVEGDLDGVRNAFPRTAAPSSSRAWTSPRMASSASSRIPKATLSVSTAWCE